LKKKKLDNWNNLNSSCQTISNCSYCDLINSILTCMECSDGEDNNIKFYIIKNSLKKILGTYKNDTN